MRPRDPVRGARRGLGLTAVLSLLASGCATEAAEPAGTVVLRLDASTTGAAAELVVGEERLEAVRGPTCWRPVLADPAVCRDDLPRELPGPVGVARGVPIVVRGRPAGMTAHWLEAAATPEDLLEVPQVEPILFRDGRAVVRVGPGRYTLSVFARWQRGEAAFYFPVVVG